MNNRPRNRQPRPSRHGQGQKKNRRSDPSSSLGSSQSSPTTPQQAAGTVPTVQQVIPGASVHIILKEDQPTGIETTGVVGELLTRGNHPRGIKVRLRNGQVGRVQRMSNEAETASSAVQDSNANSTKPKPPSRFSHRYTDMRNDLDCPSEPPPRSLADFLPPSPLANDTNSDGTTNYVEVNCPFCDSFTGDEAAVTHHIDREHLS
ncbi:hypothetical protein NOR_06979 [Metarhizium rileyi]|uniref:Uncharacterized protein n=1 Tax=Metarhizium rileyi (strain RCEF 4871) TaxID=1649241 RepID=A0A166ZGN6_METRR|nr:hypothetical protein NOR_06979 [Metarhizium rileyi RCEF 4871]TWU74360.1 hypothetical protein ED733_006423 [Metarhizium rileyi]